MLTRDQIIATPASLITSVSVKEWGGCVGIKIMTAGERDAWELSAFTDGKVNRENFRATLMVHTLCDENGKPIFTLSDIPSLSLKPSPPIVRLANKAMKLNALTDADVDELTKNS
jgi:hypothetical protein